MFFTIIFILYFIIFFIFNFFRFLSKNIKYINLWILMLFEGNIISLEQGNIRKSRLDGKR